MRKYVILRKQAATRGGSGTRNFDAIGAEARTIFAYERLTPRSAASIASEPEVDIIAPAMLTRLIKPLKSAESGDGKIWGLDATGARTSSFTGQGVTVAVLDTGIDASHAAFEGLTIEQHDFTGDGDGDREGHGTHCAGTIFGRDVEGNRIGVAPGVKRALIGKVLGDAGGGDSEMLFEGMQWALSMRADIISMSLGFDFPGLVRDWVAEGWPVDLATSNALEAYRGNLRMFDAIMQLTRARGGLGGGALVIAASGNESRRDEHPDWRIAASLPAAASDVLSVAAVGRRGGHLMVAPFSNSMAVVCGPGVDIISAKAGGGLESLSGTSMACPHVAGLAALWWESVRKNGKTPSPMNVRAQILATARNDLFQEEGAEIDVGQGFIIAP